MILPLDSRSRADNTEGEPKIRRSGSMGAKVVQIQDFYDLMNFNSEQHVAIINAVIELTDLSEGSILAGQIPRGDGKFKDTSLTFFESENKAYQVTTTDPGLCM